MRVCELKSGQLLSVLGVAVPSRGAITCVLTLLKLGEPAARVLLIYMIGFRHSRPFS
jgi:hypothetical protein